MTSGRKMTNKEVVSRFKEVHGMKYSYDNVRYINNRTKVDIICNRHGKFSQLPSTHLMGSGCIFCSGKKIHWLDFIDSANKTHGNRYKYNEHGYNGILSKINITCREHGVFSQRAGHHVDGRGCPKCAKISIATSLRLTKKEMFDLILKRNNIPDSMIMSDGYIDSYSSIKIKCKIHGWSKAIASNVMYDKYTCPKCSKNKVRLKSIERAIEKSKMVHGDAYEYYAVDLSNMGIIQKIKCKTHSSYFFQNIYNHANGSGCPRCSNYGFNKNKDSVVYMLKSTDKSKIKIGITSDINQRFKKLNKDTPFNIFLSDKIEMSGSYAVLVEKAIHNHLSSCNFGGFDGSTEWFHNNNYKDLESILEEMDNGWR